jgi:hypothetical protein
MIKLLIPYCQERGRVLVAEGLVNACTRICAPLLRPRSATYLSLFVVELFPSLAQFLRGRMQPLLRCLLLHVPEIRNRNSCSTAASSKHWFVLGGSVGLNLTDYLTFCISGRVSFSFCSFTLSRVSMLHRMDILFSCQENGLFFYQLKRGVVS